jgi:hypothetical protein
LSNFWSIQKPNLDGGGKMSGDWLALLSKAGKIGDVVLDKLGDICDFGVPITGTRP